MGQLTLSQPDDCLAYLKLAEIEYRITRNSAEVFAYFKKAWELKSKKEKDASCSEESDEYKMAENWTFNRLNRFYQTKKSQRKRTEREIITFAAILLFSLILIYNFYSNFQLVILLILVVNLVSIM